MAVDYLLVMRAVPGQSARRNLSVVSPLIGRTGSEGLRPLGEN